jgi:hypothetical protein
LLFFEELTNSFVQLDGLIFFKLFLEEWTGIFSDHGEFFDLLKDGVLLLVE